MSPMLAQPNLPTPLLVSEKPKKQAKAALKDVRKAETGQYYASLGGCIREVQHISGLTLKEFAAVVDKDERQLERQMDGKERPQLEAVFAVEKFRGPLVIALARLAADVDVVTTIEVRRSA